MSSYNNITLSPSINMGSGISGLSALSSSPISILDTFTVSGSEYFKVKKYEVYETPEDALALSVAWKRLRDSNMNTASKLLDRALFEVVNSDDHAKAKEIRDYYSKKIMMWKLKGTAKFTPYRDELNKFVHSDGLIIRQDVIGLIYYLPIFYEYDTQLDSVKNEVEVNQSFLQMDKELKPKVLSLTAALEPIKKINKKRKRISTTEYWFKDQKLNAAVCVTLEKKNPLEHIWEHLFNNEKVLQIQGHYCRRYLDEFEYFSINNWTLQQA